MDEHIADKTISLMKSNTKSERLCQSGKQLLIQAEIALFWQSPLKLGKVVEHIRNFLKMCVCIYIKLIIFSSQTTDLLNLVTCALQKTVAVEWDELQEPEFLRMFEIINFESICNNKIYCEWKRSATNTASRGVGLPHHGTVLELG